MSDLVVPRGFEQIVSIGCGAFGTVYSAWETAKKRKVAIKEYKVRQLSSGVLRAMKTELEIIPCINHPNLVQHYNVFNDIPGKIMLSMEFLESGSLSNLIDKYHQCRQNIPETFIWDITAQMVLALRYLHSPMKENAANIGRIIHRDLKPDNVFLSSTGAVKIGDFNLSRVIESADAKMTFAGTFSYMAPEVLLRKPYNEKVDIWSLGCIVCEMCTNRPIFNFSHSTDYGTEFSRFSVQNLRLPPGKYSPELVNFIHNILVIDHSSRPSSAELAQAPQIITAVKRLIDRGVYKNSILNDLVFPSKSARSGSNNGGGSGHGHSNSSTSSNAPRGDDDQHKRGSRSASLMRTSRSSSARHADVLKSSKQYGHGGAQQGGDMPDHSPAKQPGSGPGGTVHVHVHGSNEPGERGKRYPNNPGISSNSRQFDFTLLENPSVYGDAAIKEPSISSKTSSSGHAYKDKSADTPDVYRQYPDGTNLSIDTSALPAYLKRMTDSEPPRRSRPHSSKQKMAQNYAAPTLQHSGFAAQGGPQDYYVEDPYLSSTSCGYSRGNRSDSRANRNGYKNDLVGTPLNQDSRQVLSRSSSTRDLSKRSSTQPRTQTNLMRAAAAGDLKSVKQWMMQIRQYDEEGRTALMYAAMSDSLSCVEMLLPDECRMADRVGNTALMHAVLNKRFNCIQPLLRQETGLRDIKGRTALMKAAATGQLSIATLLLGTEGGLVTPDGSTALTYAANHNDMEMVNLLFSLEFAVSEPKLNEMIPTFTKAMRMHLQQLQSGKRK